MGLEADTLVVLSAVSVLPSSRSAVITHLTVPELDPPGVYVISTVALAVSAPAVTVATPVDVQEYTGLVPAPV